MPRLPIVPELDWSASGAPRAAAFDDIYFSRDGGLAEAEAVFLAGCGLPEAWTDRSHFSICELGFGAGLNVLAAWKAWKKTRSPHAILHICSVEAFPLARADAARVLAHFPEVADFAELLLARWPVRAFAPQRLWFVEDGFALTLLTGQAESVLAGLSGTFDAWFLDGFAPARNSAMWSPTLLRRVAELSAPGARAATFSVAGDVRRGLQAAGFEVSKRPGFAGKRERLEARFPATPMHRAHTLYPYQSCAPKRVAILGAGIAGAATAAALARRNVETIVLEAAPALGAGASGNPAGLIMPRLDRGASALNEMFVAAYLDAIATYSAMGADVFTPCGVEEFSETRNAAAMADLINDPPLPPDWYAPSNGAILHPRAGLVRPLAAIETFLRGATLMCDAPVGAIEQGDDGWLIQAPEGKTRLKADAVVLACGPALTRFEAARFLPLELTRGQLEWGAGPAPERAITRGSFAAPFDDGIVFGATFDRLQSMIEIVADNASRRRNLNALARLAPELQIDPTQLRSRASIRAALPDRAPIAGLLPDAPEWLKRHAGIGHGRKPDLSTPAPAHAGVYVLGGLGARGLTLAPLLGERIAAEMFGEPQALSGRALDAIHPARFLHRALKRSS